MQKIKIENHSFTAFSWFAGWLFTHTPIPSYTFDNQRKRTKRLRLQVQVIHNFSIELVSG